MASISGTVTDSNGDPMGNVQIVVIDTSASDPANWFVAGGTTTNADGTYSVAGLDSSEYLVSAQFENSENSQYYRPKESKPGISI